MKNLGYKKITSVERVAKMKKILENKTKRSKNVANPMNNKGLHPCEGP